MALNLGEVGLRIKKCRELQGFTREVFAEKVNVTPRFIYDIELGNKGMSIDTLSCIGKTLNVSLNYLLFGETPDDNPVSPATVALVSLCPEEKLDYLNEIIKNYIAAIKE